MREQYYVAQNTAINDSEMERDSEKLGFHYKVVRTT